MKIYKVACTNVGLDGFGHDYKELGYFTDRQLAHNCIIKNMKEYWLTYNHFRIEIINTDSSDFKDETIWYPRFYSFDNSYNFTSCYRDAKIMSEEEFNKYESVRKSLNND